MTSSRIALIALLCVGCNDTEAWRKQNAERGNRPTFYGSGEASVELWDRLDRIESRLARLAADSARCADHFVDANKKVDTCRWFYSEYTVFETYPLNEHVVWDAKTVRDSIWHCEPNGGE